MNDTELLEEYVPKDDYQSNTTPCDYPDNDGHYHCPYSDDPSSETCRNYCGLGVDE